MQNEKLLGVSSPIDKPDGMQRRLKRRATGQLNSNARQI